jgi:putative tricarboxylic transport membrane protein
LGVPAPVGSTMEKQGKRFDVAEFVLGLALIAIAVVLWIDASLLSLGSPYGVGPSAAPKIVACGLAVLGLATLLVTLRGTPADTENADWTAVLVMLAGFAALIGVIARGGGFIAASTILFAATSWAFGRRALVTDVALGFVLATCLYLVFTKLLTLGLPQGPLERLL